MELRARFFDGRSDGTSGVERFFPNEKEHYRSGEQSKGNETPARLPMQDSQPAERSLRWQAPLRSCSRRQARIAPGVMARAYIVSPVTTVLTIGTSFSRCPSTVRGLPQKLLQAHIGGGLPSRSSVFANAAKWVMIGPESDSRRRAPHSPLTAMTTDTRGRS